jgi:prepilin-type N-terminal cleavage/methylation domain-containing protein
MTAMKKIAANDLVASTPRRRAFTLIELLTVIAVIAILAAFAVPLVGSIKKREYINKSQAEMAQLETAIESYKSAYGFYPSSSAIASQYGALTNQLYFELLGTTNSNSAGGQFQTLDGSAKIDGTTASETFGVAGFMNCNKGNSDESSTPARAFLADLKPAQSITLFTNATSIVKILIGSVGGPDASYQPLGTPNVNPWRYVSPGINNPNGYDLWIQLVIKPGQTNLVCNWSKQIQINSSLP